MTPHAPIATRPGLPRWAVGLTVFVFLVGAVYLGSNLSGTNPPIAGPSVKRLLIAGARCVTKYARKSTIAGLAISAG